MRSGFALLYLGNCIRLIAAVSTDRQNSSTQDVQSNAKQHHGIDPSQSSIYMSNKYTDAHLKSLNFRYDPFNPLTKDQLSAIRDPLVRSQHSDPDAEREVMIGGKKASGPGATPNRWISTGKTHAEFVLARLNTKRQDQRNRVQRQKQARQEEYEKTGVMPALADTRVRRERMERNRSGDPNEAAIFRVKTPGTELERDRKGRSKGEYLDALREGWKMRNRRGYEALKMRRKGKREQKKGATSSSSHLDQPDSQAGS